MRSPNILENTIGWFAAILILLAYALNSFGIVAALNPAYILFNLFGAIGIAYVSFRYKNYQSVLINIVWLTVAIISLLKIVT